MRNLRNGLALLAVLTVPVPTALAHPIYSTLDGCVSAFELGDATWFIAGGTMQLVAFHDDQAGCAPTIETPLHDAFLFDEDRVGNFLTAWARPDVIPACGRVQFDAHVYLAEGVLDPTGLKSLVVDTEIDCHVAEAPASPGLTKRSPEAPSVPEPSVVWLSLVAVAGLALSHHDAEGTRRRVRGER